jgi:hypothetical protein
MYRFTRVARWPGGMAPSFPLPHRPTRSLKHEYQLYVEQEIENYKESVARSVLLAIGDEAVASLASAPQFALTELLLCEEVDRIIVRRLRLPVYDTWRRRRVKLIDELRRPEHWGFRPDDFLVRALQPSSDGRALVAGAADESSTLYFAANGYQVTTLGEEIDAVERVMQAAIGAGLASRVHAELADLSSWTPPAERLLNTVIVNPAALDRMSAEERARVIADLQRATLDGGVHLVPTIPSARGDGDDGNAISLEELRSRYKGWEVTVERSEGRSKSFFARKGAA